MAHHNSTDSRATRQILVVDDEEVVRRGFQRVLANECRRVETAGTGEQALQAMEARPYDIVLLDLRMPGMDGMALTEAVPAGQYGKAALQSVSLWDEVAADVAEADNVRAALALVALGEAPLGIVYATDARAEPRVHVAGWFAGESHKAIRYPVALLRRDGLAEQSDAARALFAALRAPAARAIFAAQGFTEVAP
mgnify:CR=1 FL=1